MKFYCLVTIALISVAQSKSMSTRLSRVKDKKSCYLWGTYIEVGELFPLMKCYDCSFDNDCHISCIPSVYFFCIEHIEYCKVDEEYYPINWRNWELEPEPNCYSHFDENCHRSKRCEQATTTTTTTTPDPLSPTCKYNGREYPKEEKLWYMEYDQSCYMYFEGNCIRFSRCELGGGVFYCKFRGRFRKVGEWFGDPNNRYGHHHTYHKFDSRCRMRSRAE